MLVGDGMDLSIARKHIEKLYLDRMTVIEYQEVTDPESFITSHQEVVVHENVPCKLSHHMPQVTGDGEAGSLFLSSFLTCSPDLVINAGSKIEVTRNGVTTAYKNSGEPARGLNHQKIMLEIFKDWS